ncbi:hypothetical protein Pan44_42170 [Caulifigura coniformis]|uniref:Uncharacterized protein n=1 Tax=Caulifigura coniformis TaxID=2527983 RepID=A0A517SJ75_9PLAN|nr:hypothetical protein Pan44_42170 [Caulifigura coniformis]
MATETGWNGRCGVRDHANPLRRTVQTSVVRNGAARSEGHPPVRSGDSESVLQSWSSEPRRSVSAAHRRDLTETLRRKRRGSGDQLRGTAETPPSQSIRPRYSFSTARPARASWSGVRPHGHSTCPARRRKLPGPMSDSRCGTRRNHLPKGSFGPQAPSGRRRLFSMRNLARQVREFVLWQRKQRGISPARGGEKHSTARHTCHTCHRSRTPMFQTVVRCHRSSQVSPPGGRPPRQRMSTCPNPERRGLHTPCTTVASSRGRRRRPSGGSSLRSASE